MRKAALGKMNDDGDGLDDDSVTDQDGTVWRKTDLDDMNSTYGDMSYMWEYY